MNRQKKNKSIVSIERLRTVYKATDEARQSILKCFPYDKMTTIFCQELKILLKNRFRENITFDRDEIFGCIHGSYQGAKFEIKTWCGIILTIENEKNAEIINIFKPIFNELIEADPICKYDYCSCMDEVYPTIEWSLHPQERLYELVNMTSNDCGTYKRNFYDFYTANIIECLGEQLLTQEGYNAIFECKRNNIKYHFYKIRLIQTLKPNIDNNTLYNWIDNCQAYNEINKQLVK